ncbi:hypothetical protein [Nitrobacter sp. TKz-YC01]|uniref:hypothetical protein n=1 Tax=Nitrobacter sp. TKz-YC01 TaxID=3398703 RepID=UPI003A103617
MVSGASGANQIDVTNTVTALLSKIDTLSGGSGSAVAASAVTLHTGTASNLTITSSNAAAFNSLGFTGGGVTQARTPGTPAVLGARRDDRRDRRWHRDQHHLRHRQRPGFSPRFRHTALAGFDEKNRSSSRE